MLRIAVIALFVLNLGYYAWSQGALTGLGLGPSDDREPRRVEQQIAPDALQLRTPTKAAADTSKRAEGKPDNAPANIKDNIKDDSANRSPQAGHSPIGPVACWQVGTFDASQESALRSAAAKHLPEGSWTLQSTAVPGRWMVYMGRFADKETLAQKRNELRRIKIDSAPPGPQWEPGLSLGRFPTEENAKQELDKLSRQGVRTARVVQERGDTPGWTLRLPQSDVALRNQLRAFGPLLAGKQMRECAPQ